MGTDVGMGFEGSLILPSGNLPHLCLKLLIRLTLYTPNQKPCHLVECVWLWSKISANG
jgi:hypothetical protein